jgi:hypothetical protein
VFPGNSKASTAADSGHQFAVFLHRGQVVEGIGIAKLARADEAHEQVANVSPVLGLIEERVLAVENCFLQCSLAKVIIQWGPGNCDILLLLVKSLVVLAG